MEKFFQIKKDHWIIHIGTKYELYVRIKQAKEQNKEAAFWRSKTNNFKRSISNAEDKSYSKAKDYNLKYFDLETIDDFNRYIDKALSGNKLGGVTGSASKYYRQAIEATDFLNIKVNFRRIIYDVGQMNFEVFSIVATYSKIIRN